MQNELSFETWLESKYSNLNRMAIEAVIRLTSEGATLPFIARYRKEQTGNLDEVGIQNILDGKEQWDDIIKRQTYISSEIAKNPKLDEQKKKEITDLVMSTFNMTKLDDIFLPYKQKKKSKAAKAREAGLEPLANWIWNCGHGTEKPLEGQTLEVWAYTFKNDAFEIKEAKDAIEGAQDILVERLSEMPHLRDLVRKTVFGEASVITKKGEKAKEHSKYEKFFEHREAISSLLKPENSHRYLAVRRGWMEDELKLSFDADGLDEKLLGAFEDEALTEKGFEGAAVLLKSAKIAYKTHVLTSIHNESHQALKTEADKVAIRVFSENVRKLLLASPFGPKAVVGVDPGIRTGCKIAVVDASGKFMASSVIHTNSEEDKAHATKIFKAVFENTKVQAVAIGNGTAGRETESFLRKLFKEEFLSALASQIPVVMVNESGASVYSASEAAREEFPELDVTVRGAISIARRLQDPLAELVKIDPKSIGVGQYQHDVSQHSLKKSLEGVVDLCVNQVGVNLNTASYHLLAHVSGIGDGLAKSIVEHREKNGLFKSRDELMKVSRFQDKTFEQAAGFLRIPEGDNPLDNTGVHPERYSMLQDYAKKISKSVTDFIGSGVELLKQAKELKDEIGEFTFKDIIDELSRPGRDPRKSFVPFQFREDIHEMSDLKKDMVCPGIVTNVTNFGAFVDIGVHQDGLVHLSQLANRFVKDPREVVSPGDRVQVKVLEVNLEKKQIALTMKDAKEKAAQQPQQKRQQAKPQGERPMRPQQKPSMSANAPKSNVTIKPVSAAPIKPGKPNGKKESRPNIKQKEGFNTPFANLASLMKTNK